MLEEDVRGRSRSGARGARRRSLRIACVGLLLAALQPAAIAAVPTVIINEVHYHPADDSLTGEFIELLNLGDEPVDLEGWLLVGGVQYRFASSRIVPPNDFLVLASDAGEVAARYGLDPDRVVGNYEGNLSNGGESIELWTSDGYLASFVTYGDSDPWPESPDGLGPSLERISTLREEADPHAWTASIPVGGTPGRVNSVHVPDGPLPSDLRLDLVPWGAEWRFLRGGQAPPAGWQDPGFDDSDWERGPAGFGYGDGDDATVLDDMAGSYLMVYIRTTFEVEDPGQLRLLTLGILYDDGFVAYLNGVEIAVRNVPAIASHEADSPEEIVLVGWEGLLQPGTNVLALEGHNTDLASSDFSLSPALFASLLSDEEPPPDEPVSRPPRDLVINEVAPGGPGTGWVEVYNPAPSPLDASGRRLVPSPGEAGGYAFPPGTVIPPRGFLLVSESGLGFEVDGVHACVLETADGSFVDGLNPRDAAAGESSGRFPDGADNRFVFPSPTPGEPNEADLQQPVVIHEIMYHPADSNTGGEYIELHNRSAAAVDLSGWAFTRGIAFVFPPGTTIEPGAFLVVARDPEAIQARYGLPAALGPWEGGLRNNAETLVLRDALENIADRVRYADEGSWPESADGLGPSLELSHPSLENRYGPAWRASQGEGTPGARNSAFLDDPQPIVVGVEHAPVVPEPGQSVRVLATASDEGVISGVTLFYEVDGGGAPAQVQMVDDGVGDDRVANNRVYGATIPPHPDRSIVAFWIRADAAGGQSATVPAGTPGRAFLYQVEQPSTPGPRPAYRIVMRGAALRDLRTRSVNSDVLLDVTFVANDRAYYNRGIRYRGSSARRCNPLSYRVQFDHDRDLHGIKRLNLNGCNAHRQWIGLDFLGRTGVPTPQSWFRQLSLNGQLEPALHLRVEAIDVHFLERVLPEDSEGNLYRGMIRADLDYRGEDFADYRGDYRKDTNEDEADYSDMVDLSFRFDAGTTGDGDFPAAIEEKVDVSQWAGYFASYAILGSTENSILLDNGDDYFLYHRRSDDRFILLPWDLDSCFDEANQALFRPTVDAIERFLEHRLYAPLYWCHLAALMDTAFDPERVNSRIDHLAPLFSPSLVAPLRSYVNLRRAFLSARLSGALTLTSASGGAVCNDVLYPYRSSVTVAGRAPACMTSSVVVNGLPASYDVTTAFWSAEVDVSEARFVDVAALDRDDGLLELFTIDVEAVSGDVGPLPSELHVQRAGANHVAFKAVEVAGITDPDGDGEMWQAVAGVAGALGTGGTVLRAPNGGRLRELGQSVAVYRIRFASAGVYRAYYRSRGFDNNTDSLWLPSGFDREPDLNVRTPRGTFAWLEEGSFTVTAGHVSSGEVLELQVGVREFNTELDAIALSTVSGLSQGELDSLVSETGVPPRAIALALPSSQVALSGGRATVTLEGSRSHDGQCGVAALSYLWEKLAGPPGDSFQGDVTSDSVDVAFSDPGEYVYRLTVSIDGAGTSGSAEVAITVVAGTEQTFTRCDSSGDGAHNITDSVFTLNMLFLGGPDATCMEAADCDGDGSLNVTDAIFGLNYLFLGGPAPSPPYPGCESAPEEVCGTSTCFP